jgi:hypothetical protein
MVSRAMPEPVYLRTTRAAYDAVAGDYAERFRTELEAKPLGRAMLAAFAELVGELLERAGFVVDARLVREPDATEKVPQAHLLARSPRPL